MLSAQATKDWTGNKRSTFATLGASNHVPHDRAFNDYYATEPRCAEELLDLGLGVESVWECAAGEGHLAKVFERRGVLRRASDLVDRGYGEGGVDFLMQSEPWKGWRITNPPYKFAQEFCERALFLAPNVAMFLKLTFLEGQRRRPFFEKHPPHVFVYSSRRKCALNGHFDAGGSSAAAYAWFVWQGGSEHGATIRWI